MTQYLSFTFYHWSMASADTEGLFDMEELLAVEEEDDLARSYARLDITECTVQCHEIFPNQRQQVISAWPGVYSGFMLENLEQIWYKCSSRL